MSRFFAAYEGDQPPPWDIGQPQPVFVDLELQGLVRGPVIDVGCGTGENALHLAARGHEVLGIDLVPRAIERARHKAAARGLAATFVVGDVLELGSLGRTFQTAIDCGVFHVFDDADRARYVRSLALAVAPGGRVHILVFSDKEPTDWGGPRRIRRQEFEQAFTPADGWRVEAIVPALFAAHHLGEGGHAWHATIERTA